MPLFYRNLGKWLTSLLFFFVLHPWKILELVLLILLTIHLVSVSVSVSSTSISNAVETTNEFHPVSVSLDEVWLNSVKKFSILQILEECVLVVNKKPFSTLYCKSKTEVVTQAYLSKSKYYQGSMRSPAKKTNDLKHRKTWVNMSSLAVFLVCPFSKNVLNTSTLKWVFHPKSLSSCIKLDRWCELSSFDSA